MFTQADTSDSTPIMPHPPTGGLSRRMKRKPTSSSSAAVVAPPRLAVAIPAYRVHKAKHLGYVRVNGRIFYLGRAGSTESQDRYRRWVAEWLATGRLPEPRGPGPSRDQSVEQLGQAYLRWAEQYYRGADGRTSPGLEPVRSAISAMNGLYGDVPVHTFGPVALRAVREAMVRGGLCRNVINQRIACVKRVIRWGVAEGLVEPSVLHGLQAVEPLRRGRSGARETKPMRPVPDADVDAVIPFLPPTLATMVRLQRLTGLRSGELCIIRTCDICQGKPLWTYRPATHKTAHHGHDRVVRLGPRAQHLLERYLRPEDHEAYVFSPARAVLERRHGGLPDTAMQPSNGEQASRRYSPRSYRRALSYAMDAAVVQGAITETQRWHPHQLRHRYATAVRQARGLDAARVVLGHRTLSQTLEYAEADAQLAELLVQELG